MVTVMPAIRGKTAEGIPTEGNALRSQENFDCIDFLGHALGRGGGPVENHTYAENLL
jgi:hypothetical protein